MSAQEKTFVCYRCGKLRLLSEYKETKSGYVPAKCLYCVKENRYAQHKVRRQARKQRDPLYGRKNHLRKYKLTIEDYEALERKQRGRCAVCRRFPRQQYRMVVDHDHDTGKVRGLLCNRCNIGVAYIEDPNFVDLVRSYLARSTP